MAQELMSPRPFGTSLQEPLFEDLSFLFNPLMMLRTTWKMPATAMAAAMPMWRLK